MADGEAVVRDLVHKICEEKRYKLKDVKIKSMSTEGANYTSTLYTISVTTDVENLELFAKVAIISEELRKHMNADWIYVTEKIVYEKLVPVYEVLQDKFKVPDEHRFIFPKCYCFNTELGQETVVMENLMKKGYVTYDRFKTMDWNHAALSMELLAKFHALSFAYDKVYPEEYQEMTSKLINKSGPKDENDESLIPIWIKMVERAVSVIDEEELREKIRKIMMEKDIMKKYVKPIGKPILCHGDYRLSNILFRRQGETLQGIPLDYQLVNSGCLAADLIFFIFMGSDEEFRREHYDRLLNHYYEHLSLALRRFDLDPVEVYPRETFDDHMKQTLPYILVIGVVMLPVVTVEAEDAPNMANDDNFQSFIVPVNDLYASRFRGFVNDCVRWGVL